MRRYIVLLISASLFGVFLYQNKSNANLLGNYKIQKKSVKVDQRRVVGSGSRSSCQPSVKSESVELLVPDEEVAHRTLTTRPPLYVYSKNTKLVNVEFTLVDAKNSVTEDVQRLNLNEGVNKIELSPEVALKNREVYIWNVVIPCKNDVTDRQTVLNAGIQKIEPANLPKKPLQSKLQLIESYMSHGIWYESVDLILRATNSERDLLNSMLVEDYDDIKNCFWKDCSKSEDSTAGG